MPPRAERAAVSPFLPLGFCWQKPCWASDLVVGLLASFIAGSALLVFCSRVRAAAKHSVLTSQVFTSKTICFYRCVRPLSRLQQAKNSHEGGRQSFSRTALQSQLAKFCPHPKFCPKERTRNQKVSRNRF